ncbi:MAG: nucleotidyltransferase family protein [bacterium]|nr:nucleotidyltransferase family protein [bacterium]
MENLKKILVNPELSAIQTIKQMDETGEKILFVTNKAGKLLGTVTDGDIRRWILKGKNLSESVDKVMNGTPIVLKVGYSEEEAKDLMVINRIECIPVVDKDRRIVSAVWWTELFSKEIKIKEKINLPVVIMAGGKSLRLHPFTKILPKPLIPIGEKPILELIMDRFQEYGCKKFYLSVNYKANIIKAYFSDFKHDYNINYIQEEMPLGTAGSLYLLKKRINSTFWVSNCDILIEADYADILRFHKDSKNKITIVASMKHYTIPYGIVNISKGGNLKSIEEKPEYNFLVNTGMYILEPEILKDIPDNKFYNITDLICSYNQAGKKIGVYPISEKAWLDIGEWGELQETLKRFGIE